VHIQTAFRATNSSSQTGIGGSDPLSSTQSAAITLFPADAPIYAQGDEAHDLYMVEFGTVRISRVTSDGRRQITGFLTAGDVFGFEADDEHESCAESVDGAGVRVLRSACRGEPTAALLKMALKGLARTQQQLMLLGCRSANARMAAFLLDLSERQANDHEVHLPMQRNDVADYLGLTFETVSRTLRFLKDAGMIRLKTISDVQFLDRDALEQLCE
jgi:CRP/FNR family nitrogen fixation transcriptional regulator